MLIATPVTLMALLRTVGVYWQQQALAENARELGQAAKDLYERVAKYEEHLSNIGVHLGRAGKAYNEAVGSYNRRVLPAGQRIQGLEVAKGTRRTLAGLKAVESVPEPTT